MPAILELIPDLGALVAWAAIALLVIGLVIFRDWIVGAFSHVPVIGPWVGNNLGQWLTDSINALNDAKRALWGAAVTMFRWTLHIFEAIQRTEWNIAIAAWQFGSRLYDVTLPNLESRLLIDASNWFNNAVAFAQSLYNTLARDVSIVQADIISLATELPRDIATAEQNAIATADATASALVGGVYTDLERTGAQALREAWPTVEGDIGALRGVLGKDFPDIQGLLGALGGLGATGILAALIQSLAGAQAITKLATDCIVPQCRNLGGLSHDLGNLTAPASEAAMFAWVLFAITDPAGWAQEMETVAGPIARDTANLATMAFGLGAPL